MVKCNRELDTPLIYLLLKTIQSIFFIGFRKKKRLGGVEELVRGHQLEIKYRCAQPQSSPFFYYSTINKHGMRKPKGQMHQK